MLLDMQLYMPTQEPVTEDDFTFSARATNKWIKAIPVTTFESTGALLRDYIAKANRTNVPSKERLASIDALQPISRRLIDELHKYLACQTFPLSPRANQAYKLQQSLLNELSIAYKIIIVDTIESQKRPDNKKLFHCVSNAINYIAEQYLSCIFTYQEFPAGLWYEISQIYRIAEHKNFHQKKTKTDLVGDQSTIEQIFKHLCALTLISFNKLRQGEAEKTCNFLFKHQDLINFSSTAENITSNSIYVANLATGKQPAYYIPRELPISNENRFIDYQVLVEKLEQLTSQPTQPYSYYLQTGEIEPELAKRLAKMINGPSERGNDRINSRRTVRAVLGLTEIVSFDNQVDEIAANKEKENTAEQLYHSLSNISLVPTEHSIGSYSSELFELEATEKASDVWDPFENKNTKDMQVNLVEEEKTLLSPKSDDLSDWQVENYSSSGFCLYYDSQKTRSMRVGEVVGILKPQNDKTTSTLTIGITRWMQGMSEQTHKIGIELLSGQHTSVYARYEDNKLKDLPAILLKKVLNDKNIYTILLPAATNITGKEILLSEKTGSHLISLGKPLESTGCFTHFEITTISSKSS